MQQPTVKTARDMFESRNPRMYSETFAGQVINEIELDAAPYSEEVICDVEVFFTYTRAERATWDYPGCPAEIEICGTFDANTGAEVDVSDEYIEEIETKLWNRMEKR